MYLLLRAFMDPLPLGLLAALLVIILLWRRHPKQRRGLTVLGVIVLLIGACCTPIAANLAARTLECHFPRDQSIPAKVDAIVVLGCGVRFFDKECKDTDLDANSAFRCMRAVQVYREVGPCPIIVSGGKSNTAESTPSTSQVMRDFLISVGVKPEDVLTEEKARDTYENAIYSIEMLRKIPGDQVVLVTDATHMLRSKRCFETQGQEVIPAGSQYRGSRLSWSASIFIPSGAAAEVMDCVAHEWVGFLWYKLRGRI
ncbi:MAG: YdcF family protein [Pirellulales bacterium]|nr:YdcF family protein [Pirellulales bacterium]